MINKQRANEIFALALPIIGGMISQNLLNLIDAAMVGHLGPVALAAVGFCSFINFMAAAIFIGLSVGVQALVGRRIGEGKSDIAARPLTGGLLINLLVALPFSVLLIALSPNILSLLLSDQALIEESVPYLQARFAGIMAMGMNFCFRGFFSAVKLTNIYLKTIITIHVINVIVSYCLIFGFGPIPALGSFGAGLGTSIALFIGTLIYLGFTHRHGRVFGFGFRLPRLPVLRQVLAISIPASIQQVFFAAGFTALFWIVSLVGTEEVAVANVLINISMIGILPSLGFGIAANTLVAQSLGRSEPEAAYIWAWDVGKIAALVSFFIGLAMILLATPLLSLFLHQEDLIAIARTILYFIGLSLGLEALGLVLMNALQGAGATKLAMQVTLILQWLVCLPLAYVLGPVLGFGLVAIWLTQVGYRSVQALTFTSLWRGRSWQKVKV